MNSEKFRLWVSRVAAIDLPPFGEDKKRLDEMKQRICQFVKNVIARFGAHTIVLIERGGLSMFFSIVDQGNVADQELNITAIDVDLSSGIVQINPESIRDCKTLIFDDMMYSGKTMRAAIEAVGKFASDISISSFCISGMVKKIIQDRRFQGIPIDYSNVVEGEEQQMEFVGTLTRYQEGLFFPSDITSTYLSGSIKPSLTSRKIREFANDCGAAYLPVKSVGIEKIYLVKNLGDCNVWLKIYFRQGLDFRAFGYLCEGSSDFCNSCEQVKRCKTTWHQNPGITLCRTVENKKIKHVLDQTVKEMAERFQCKAKVVDDPVIERICSSIRNRRGITIWDSVYNC